MRVGMRTPRPRAWRRTQPPGCHNHTSMGPQHHGRAHTARATSMVGQRLPGAPSTTKARHFCFQLSDTHRGTGPPSSSFDLAKPGGGWWGAGARGGGEELAERASSAAAITTGRRPAREGPTGAKAKGEENPKHGNP